MHTWKLPCDRLGILSISSILPQILPQTSSQTQGKQRVSRMKHQTPSVFLEISGNAKCWGPSVFLFVFRKTGLSPTNGDDCSIILLRSTTLAQGSTTLSQGPTGSAPGTASVYKMRLRAEFHRSQITDHTPTHFTGVSSIAHSETRRPAPLRRGFGDGFLRGCSSKLVYSARSAAAASFASSPPPTACL